MPFRSYLLRLLLIISIITTLAAFAQSQCTQKLNELPPTPELLGFHMGMTKEEVKVRVPQTVFGRTDDFGVSKTTINPYFDPKIDKSKFESVRSVSLDLLDDHLTSLWIGYDETFKVQSIDAFVKLISESLRIQGAWSSWKSRGQQIRCDGFQLIVATVAGGPSLRILDTTAEEMIATRRQAKEERDSAIESGQGVDANVEIVGDKQAKVYYLTNCPPAREVSEANKILFKSSEEAEKAGYKLGKSCH